MKRCGLIVVIISCSIFSLAQSDSTYSRKIGISYFSEGGLYPGFTLNYEKKLLGNNRFQLLVAGKAGAYFHYQNHTGVFVMIQSGQRYHISKHFHLEHFLGVGYLHSFLSGGDAYFVNASGQVQKAGNAGNPHFMPSISLGVSYDYTGKHPVTVFARPMIFWQLPFNTVSLVQYGFEIGTLFRWKK